MQLIFKYLEGWNFVSFEMWNDIFYYSIQLNTYNLYTWIDFIFIYYKLNWLNY